MESIIRKVRSEYAQYDNVDVSLLTESGDFEVIYHGPAIRLKMQLISEALSLPGCFYILAFQQAFSETFEFEFDDPVEKEQASRKVLDTRREICFLTDPVAPILQSRTSNSINLEWLSPLFCGMSNSTFEGKFNFILEAAEGIEWKPGVVRHFIAETSDVEYRMICRGNSLTFAEVRGLKPATWYHFRICIEFKGKYVYSESRAIPTCKSIPDVPKKPRIRAEKRSDNTNKTTVSKVKVLWTVPGCNGAPIERYQLQLQEVTYGNIDDPKRYPLRWNNVYNNFQNSCFLPLPAVDCLEWRLRLKAKNSEGWTSYGPILVVNRKSNPVLFTAKGETGAVLSTSQNQGATRAASPTTTVNLQNLDESTYEEEFQFNDIYSLYEASFSRSDGSKARFNNDSFGGGRPTSPIQLAAKSMKFSKKVADEASRISSNLGVRQDFVYGLIENVMRNFELQKEINDVSS